VFVQAAIDRIMMAYGLMVNLRMEDEAAVRRKLIDHLRLIDGDERVLTVEGLKFLRASLKLSQ
jgi:hypothetical protein